MTKTKPEPLPSDWRNLRVPAAYGVAVIVAVIGGYAWLTQTFAQQQEVVSIKQTVVVAQAQAQTALDTQMEDLMARIAHLEAKTKKTDQDRDQVKYLRDQLERLRKMRAIK